MTHQVVVGLGFGDEGKGRMVDQLCHDMDIAAVVRFNGGAQAAHNVVQPDGRHHTFSQFGSGTFHNVPTFLSKYFLINLLNLHREHDALTEKVGHTLLKSHLFIDHHATVILPYHRWANRLREDLRGEERHGSVGVGIGEAVNLKLHGTFLTMCDMDDDQAAFAQISEIYDHYATEFGDAFTDGVDKPLAVYDEQLRAAQDLVVWHNNEHEQLLDSGDCVFEGAQGVLLDERFGFHPHTTWSKTTPTNAFELLEGRESQVIGMTRSYMTRHGHGPFPSEVFDHDDIWPEVHNKLGQYQGGWRRGLLDLPLLSYAVQVCGRVDAIGVTHLDSRLAPVVSDYPDVTLTVTDAFRLTGDREYQSALTKLVSGKPRATLLHPESHAELVRLLEDYTGVPVDHYSFGPTSMNTARIKRRSTVVA